MRRILVASALTAAVLFGGLGCARESPGGDSGDSPAEISATTPVPSEEPADLAAEGGQEAPINEAADGGAAPAETPPLPGELLPMSDDRPLAETDINRLTNWQLTLARDEIYARHGRVFQNAYIRKHFEEMTWYTPDENYDDANLSLLERENADYILKYQNFAFESPATNP